MKLGDSIRRIRAILFKDLRDAIRDARVLFAILVPLGVGLFYNFIFDDEVPPPSATVAITVDTGAEFEAVLAGIVEPAMDVEFIRLTDDEIREQASASDIDLGLILPPDFDEAVTSGLSPPILAVLAEDRSFGGDYVLSAIDPALRSMTGQTLPAELTVETAELDVTAITVYDRLGARTYLVLIALVLMIAMTGVTAIPIVLAEETEKKTIEALALIASYREIIIAKALLGMIYVSVATALLLLLTQLFPRDWVMFVTAVAVTGAAIMALGLLLAGVVKNANQLNTWSGVVLIPMLAPAFLVGIGLSDRVEQIAQLFPTGAAMKLFIDSYSDASVFDDSAVSYAVILVWGVVAYALLVWQLSRRRA